jgi:hypothetical protein
MYYIRSFGDDTPSVPVQPAPHEDPAWVAPVLITGLIALVGFVVYSQYKLSSQIVQKEGARGLLGYEAGRTGLGMLERASR